MDDEQSESDGQFDDISDKNEDKSSSSKGSSKGTGSSSASGSSNSSSSSSSSPPPKSNASYTAARNRYIATSVTRFGNSLSRIFRERFDEQESKIPTSVDSRLWREIEAKKKGQNISM